MAKMTKIVTISLPPHIPENYDFKEINEVNDLLNEGYHLLRLDQSFRSADQQVGLVLTMIKLDEQPLGIYKG